MFTPRVVEEREREREREKRERESEKKKMGGAGKTQKNLFVSRKFLSQIKEEREEFLVFNPPRGARTFHTSKLYQSVSRQRVILILLLIREHSDLILSSINHHVSKPRRRKRKKETIIIIIQKEGRNQTHFSGLDGV